MEVTSPITPPVDPLLPLLHRGPTHVLAVVAFCTRPSSWWRKRVAHLGVEEEGQRQGRARRQGQDEVRRQREVDVGSMLPC